MSNNYSNASINSDLDAFKNSGAIITRAVTVSGTIGGGGEAIFRATPVTVESPDFLEILCDNSVYHSGKFKPLKLGQTVPIPDTLTFGGDGSGWLFIEVNGNQVTAGVRVNNPYSSSLGIGPVTFNFRFIPYEATF